MEYTAEHPRFTHQPIYLVTLVISMFYLHSCKAIGLTLKHNLYTEITKKSIVYKKYTKVCKQSSCSDMAPFTSCFLGLYVF